MLGLLRRIRRQLFSDNQRKYFIYAFGEVILIVVGVLLALSINNWNQGRLDRNKEKAILTAIKDNLQLDTIDINVNSKFYKNAIYSDSILLNKLVTQQPYDSTLANELILLYFNELSLVLHQSAFQEAQDAGMGIIRNVDLRNNIRRLYEFDYPYILDLENDDSHLITDYLKQYLFKHDLLSYVVISDNEMLPTIDFDTYQKLLKDKEFHLLVGINISRKRNILERRYTAVSNKVLALIEQIDEELGNR